MDFYPYCSNIHSILAIAKEVAMDSNELTRLYQALSQKQRSGEKLTEEQKEVFMQVSCKMSLIKQMSTDQDRILKQMINRIAVEDSELADMFRPMFKSLQHEIEALDDIRQVCRILANN